MSFLLTILLLIYLIQTNPKMLSDDKLQAMLIHKEESSKKLMVELMKASRIKHIMPHISTGENLGPGAYFKNNETTPDRRINTSIQQRFRQRTFDTIQLKQSQSGYDKLSPQTYRPQKNVGYRKEHIILRYPREDTAYKRNFCFSKECGELSPCQYQYSESEQFMDKYHKVDPKIGYKERFQRKRDDTQFLGPGTYDIEIDKCKNLTRGVIRKHRIQ